MNFGALQGMAGNIAQNVQSGGVEGMMTTLQHGQAEAAMMQHVQQKDWGALVNDVKDDPIAAEQVLKLTTGIEIPQPFKGMLEKAAGVNNDDGSSDDSDDSDDGAGGFCGFGT